jgi:hypothetical protein
VRKDSGNSPACDHWIWAVGCCRTWRSIRLTAQFGGAARYATNILPITPPWNTIDAEPPHRGYHIQYRKLAALGIEKSKPFNPNAPMKRILERANEGRAQIRTQSFADRRSGRIVLSPATEYPNNSFAI